MKSQKNEKHTCWPDIRSEQRPWTRWWWMGSAVDKKNLSRLMRIYRSAGLGGVELTSIYPMKGQEHRNLDYLSFEWLEMVRYVINQADELDMQVDLPPGSGWRIGGPFVTDEIAGAQLCVEQNRNGKNYVAGVKPNSDKVKVPGPGGEGKSFNPFSRKALQAVIDYFTDAFKNLGIRSQFHDSWEYKSSACPELFSTFQEKRGYDFRERLSEFMGEDGRDLQARITYDLQLTLAEMALENFILPWTQWCNQMGQLSRNQAHGSPGNLLDLYAGADIPETEIYRSIVTPDTPLMSKFASSAAHVAGKPLVSSETGTWLKKHFHGTLSDMKKLADNLFISGINHIVYHGTAYSPQDAEWPGWLFYATAQINPNNSIWRDVHQLNEYIARCQSILQSGAPDNELLVYFPFHDVLHDETRIPGEHLGISVDWLQEIDAFNTFQQLKEKGYSFDYVSDRQIAEIEVEDENIRTPGNDYRALLVPPCRFMPPETLEKLLNVSKNGGRVIFISAPGDVPGWAGLEEKRAHFRKLIAQVSSPPDWELQLTNDGVLRETLADESELFFIRRSHESGHHYFIVNLGEQRFDEWIRPAVAFEAAMIMDPMSGDTGRARTRHNQQREVRLQLEPGEAWILRTLETAPEHLPSEWPYINISAPAHLLTGTWNITFIEGGPQLPPSHRTEELTTWTDYSVAAERFAGTARYSTGFDAPASAKRWLLDLGEVHASARVRLNGTEIATLIGPTFRTVLHDVKAENNILEVEITNVSANRIRDLDRRKPDWQKMFNRPIVNSIRKKTGKFSGEAVNYADAPLTPSGLIGPVRLFELE